MKRRRRQWRCSWILLVIYYFCILKKQQRHTPQPAAGASSAVRELVLYKKRHTPQQSGKLYWFHGAMAWAWKRSVRDQKFFRASARKFFWCYLAFFGAVFLGVCACGAQRELGFFSAHGMSQTGSSRSHRQPAAGASSAVREPHELGQ